MSNSISQLSAESSDGSAKAWANSASAEARLRAVLQTSPAGIGRLVDNHVVEANLQLSELTGYPLLDLIGLPFVRLFVDSREFERVQNILQAQLKPNLHLQTKWLQLDGKKLDVRLSIAPVITGNCPREWIFAALRDDPSTPKNLDARLLRAQRLEAIGALASGLAHDLNNVFAPILISVQMLKEEAAGESTDACLDLLETCARRGSEIVEQVLTLPRGTQGARIPVHPKHLLKDLQRVLAETFPRAIRLVNQVSKENPLIECDTAQMRQMLLNLCLNARDAMPKGGTLTLRSEIVLLGNENDGTHPRPKPGAYGVLSVSDTGSGIPPEVMARIFEPGFTTKLSPGTGLGLWAVKSIAENHGGFVRVESRLEKGTTVRVYLPVASHYQEAQAQDNGGDLPQGNGETVLVVDDEPAVLRILETILTKNGFRVLVAADGREAVTVFERNLNRIDLVVSDLMMPHQDGPATIRAILGRKPEIRVAAITGLAGESPIAEARAAGAESVIRKPFTAHQLLSTLEELRKQPG